MHALNTLNAEASKASKDQNIKINIEVGCVCLECRSTQGIQKAQNQNIKTDGWGKNLHTVCDSFSKQVEKAAGLLVRNGSELESWEVQPFMCFRAADVCLESTSRTSKTGDALTLCDG